MSDNTPLGDRMKRYETAYRTVLPRRAYALMRLDGNGFRAYLRQAVKPFDMPFMSDMDTVAQWLCADIQGARFAYTQSDEISLLITDFDRIQTEPWVGGRTDKMTSLAAGKASGYLTALRSNHPGTPAFDCRVWSMADPVEVANYFVWRQRDAVRNSILTVGQHYFSQKQLDGKNTDQVQEMLFQEHGVNWDHFSTGCKQGRLILLSSEGWQTVGAPHFMAQPGTTLAQLIPELPSLNRMQEDAV